MRLHEVTLNINTPHGSIVGPGGYGDYTKIVDQVIRANNIHPHFFADDSHSSQIVPFLLTKFRIKRRQKYIN